MKRQTDEEVLALVNSLTPRERQVFDVIAHGRTSAEAGAIIGISARTIEVHRMNIRGKLGMMTNDKEFGAFAARVEQLKQSPTSFLLNDPKPGSPDFYGAEIVEALAHLVRAARHGRKVETIKLKLVRDFIVPTAPARGPRGYARYGKKGEAAK